MAKYQSNVATILHTQKNEEKLNWNRKNLDPKTAKILNEKKTHIGSLQCKLNSQNIQKS